MKRIGMLCAVSLFCAGFLFAESDEAVYKPITIDIVPGTGAAGEKVSTNIALGTIGSIVYRVNGLQAAGIMSLAGEDVHGLQGSGVFNIADGSVHGLQGSGVFNISGRRVHGLQAAGVFNVAGEGFSGFQMSGVFNIAEGDSSFFQTAGVFNVSGSRFSGIQAAGVFNIGERVDGVQVAGVLNVADEMHGIQVGLINISDTMYGLPIGLINIVRNGIFDVGAISDDSGYTYAVVQKGTTNMYTVLYGGFPTDTWFATNDDFVFGAGIGARFEAKPFFLDMDISAKQYLDLDAAIESIKDEVFPEFFPFPSLRVSLGTKLFGPFKILGGFILDTEIEGVMSVNERFKTEEPMSFESFGYSVLMYPKFFVGLSL